MKKLILFSVLCLSYASFAQHNWCGFDQKMQEQFEQNPSLENQMYENYDRISSGQIVAQDRTDPMIIPVVVHVIHDGDNGNIPFSQIEEALVVLNEDFNKMNADAINARNTATAPFAPIASDMEIEFALAKIDPNGNCTNGVERRNSAVGTYNGDDTKSKTYAGGGLDAWDRNKYFNIWVVNSIDNDGDPGIILGYAQFPNWGSANTYGVIIRHDRFGVGTDRTISHEVGHCFGLAHTFQSGCGGNGSNCGNQGDGCCDTPPVDEAHWSCSQTQNNCSQIPNGDYYGFDALDQFENFMSYSPCQYMFTEDQKSIVHANMSNIGHLSNLASLSTQTATGVNLPEVLCKAEFSSTNPIICAGSTVDFADYSYSGVTGRSWSFVGGTPDVSTDSAVTITYNTPGIYEVSLNVTDGTSNQTETKTAYVSVLPVPGVALPYSEGFESITFPDNYNFFVENDDEGNTWEVTSTAASSGSKSLKMSNYNVDAGTEDRFVSGPIDLSVVDPSDDFLLTFKYAYNKKSTTDDEWLRVYVSKDCGVTWSLRKNIHGDALSTETSPGAYTPGIEDEWTSVSITNITSTYFVENFRYKIQFDGEDGNNIYIDDINLYPTSWLGTNEVEIETELNVYPNPANDMVNINFVSPTSQNVTIDIYNAVGQKVSSIFAGDLNPGNNDFSTSIAALTNGIYYIRISGDSITKTVKLTKN